MMMLTGIANKVVASAQPTNISSQEADLSDTTSTTSFTDSAPSTLANGETLSGSTQLNQENQASSELGGNEFSTDAESSLDAESDISNVDDLLTAQAQISASEQEALESFESSVLTEREEALSEPATQLWHWHYSRSVHLDQGAAPPSSAHPASSHPSTTTHTAAQLASTEPLALVPRAAQAELTGAQARAEQSSGQQSLVARAASHESAAERRFSLSRAFTEQGNTTVPQLASNKLLLQQLANGSLALAKVEEIGTSLISHGVALSAQPGRASMPVHEWAPVALDSTNKAQLGAQLLQTLKDKVELQLNQEVQQARIKLDPPEMGRLELSIRLEGDKLHIHINASHSGVRDTLNAQADRLRHDLLAQHGGGVAVSIGQGSASPQDEANSKTFRHAEQVIAMADREATELEQHGVALRGWVNTLV